MINTRDVYHRQLVKTAHWCLKSIKKGDGGSCAHYNPILGWSKPYPETTGYLIPTLYKLEDHLGGTIFRESAKNLGQWLLSIQNPDGSWCGGLHPAKNKNGSVFNTGQIIIGLMSIFRETGDHKYLDSALRAAEWLVNVQNDDGLWPGGDYLSDETPSYYTHVCWPMLEVWSECRDELILDGSLRALDSIHERIRPNGSIGLWGFKKDMPAFTHTIAYTIRGFQEASRILDDYERYCSPIEPTLEKLIRLSELSSGKLPGSFDYDWNGDKSFVCLTGNLQLAESFLLFESHENDLRIVNAAAKLVDYVIDRSQRLRMKQSLRGAVAGSYPLWGKYMMGRYPNWAAKYLCDVLITLSNRVEIEIENQLDQKL